MLQFAPFSDHDNPRFERRTNADWQFEPYGSGIGMLAPRAARATHRLE
jgi:hypothetical protein